MYAKCFEFDPCLWWYDSLGFRQSAGKAIEASIRVVPLEDDWIEWEFAAGKTPPKYEPVEEILDLVAIASDEPMIGVIQKHWTPEGPGVTPPFKFTPWNPGSPPWWCHGCGGTPGINVPDNPPEQPATVPLPDALGLMVGVVCVFTIIGLLKHSPDLETIR